MNYIYMFNISFSFVDVRLFKTFFFFKPDHSRRCVFSSFENVKAKFFNVFRHLNLYGDLWNFY